MSQNRPGLRFEVVTTRARFDELEEAWNDLMSRAAGAPQVFQTFNWNWHWANHFLDTCTALSLVIGWEGERLVMVWPLAAMRCARVRVVTWMGEPVSQYGDAIVEARADAQELLRQGLAEVRKLPCDLLMLRKTRGDAVVADILDETGALVTVRDKAPYLDLASAPDFATYEQRYSAKARKNRRRQLRRLEEEGGVVIGQSAGDARTREIVGQAIALKREWLAAKGLASPAYEDERFDAFFADVAAAHERSPGTRVTSLTCGGELAAVEIAFGHGSRLAVHIVVYNKAFEKQGAGAVLMEAGIRSAHEQGFGVYDLMAPGDAYKLDWADDSIAVSDFAVPVTVAGRLYAEVWLKRARPRLKSAINRLPPALGRAATAARRVVALML